MTQTKGASKETQMERKEDEGKCNNKEPAKSTTNMEYTKNQHAKIANQSTRFSIQSNFFTFYFCDILGLFFFVCFSICFHFMCNLKMCTKAC